MGYADGKGFETCTKCPLGKYRNSDGGNDVTDCLPCLAGSYSDFLGAETCTQCAQGRYLSSTGGNAPDACTLCGVGKYSDSLGATKEATCVPCTASCKSSACTKMGRTSDCS